MADIPGRSFPRRLTIAGVLVSLAVPLVAVACKPRGGGRAPSGSAKAVALTRAQLDQSIRMAGGYLERNCREDGQFTYVRHGATGEADDDDYNVLRHAGTIYALSMYYGRSPAPGVLNAMNRATKYLRTQCIRPVDRSEQEIMAVWSPTTELTKRDRDRPPVAKLGGAGLALVALARVEQATPGTVPQEELRALGRFLAMMQKNDGSFYSKYYLGEGPDDRWTSLYYPGEAMLGLLTLYDLDPDALWIETAEKGMAYLAHSRAGQRSVPPDHWALLATRKLLDKHRLLDNPPTTRGVLLAHAVQISESMLADQVDSPSSPDLAGAFTADGRTCPTATRLEGLQAALPVLPPEQAALRRRLDNAVKKGMSFLLKTQITSGKTRGGIPYAACRRPETPENSSFNRQVPEVRIDYVQHALSAMIQYEELFLPKQRSGGAPAGGA